MICGRCGTKTAIRLKGYYDEKNQAYKEICNECGCLDTSIFPDIYFRKRYFDENLADSKHPNGQYVESKRHKAQLLKELNLREAGNDHNPILGKPAPYIADPIERQKFFKDNYGG